MSLSHDIPFEQGAPSLPGPSRPERVRRLALVMGRITIAFLTFGVVVLLALQIALLTGTVDIPTRYLRDTQPTGEATASIGAAPEERLEVDPELVANAPGKGDPDAPILLVEFNDYQCSFCKLWATEIAPQLQSYIDRGDVRLVLLDIPSPYHPQAPVAARAAHCAREQGGDEGYWTMHDALFTSFDSWTSVSDQPLEPIFAGIADKAGLDGDKVAECLEAGSYADTVEAGAKEAERLGVMGTPTFVLNGVPVYGAQPIELFQKAIQQELPVWKKIRNLLP